MGRKEYRFCGVICRECLHRLLAAVLLLASLPVIAVFYVLMKWVARQREPFLYTGERLGKAKQPFTLYKIRTLPHHATESLNDELFRPEVDAVLAFGRFLRETRLDELPQFWNVVRGDMLLVGPRPVRAAIYRKLHATIPRYDRRFQVKPGVTGYAQLLTAHRAPKRVRAAVDAHYADRMATLPWDLCMLARTMWLMMRQATGAIGHWILNRWRIVRWTGRPEDRRTLRRVSGKHVEFAFADEDFVLDEHPEWRHPRDVSYNTMAFRSDRKLGPDDCVNLVLRVRPRERAGIRYAQCYGMVQRVGETQPPGGHHRCVVMLTPLSDYSRYIMDQYILHDRLGWW